MSEDLSKPSVGVGIAIVDDGRILLTKRRDFPVWCIPGGHLSAGESIIDAAVREAKEETGLEVSIQYLVGVYSMPFKWENGSCEIILKAIPVGGYLIRESNETVDAGYFSFEEFPNDLVGWQHHQAVDALHDKKGIIAVLDARLSISQFRDTDGRIKSGEQDASAEWLKQVCEIPERFDLSG